MASSKDTRNRLVILLPTLNEEKGVQATIREIPFGELRAAGFDPRVLVVDGRSTDRTRQKARELGALVMLQTGRGKGAAVREGMAWAVRQKVPYLVVMDADFTYPGPAIPTLASLLAAGSEMVIGVRRPDRHAMSDMRGLVHRAGNGVLNFLAGYLARGTILDVCSGLWGVRTSTLPTLDLESDGFDIESEAFVKAFRSGMSISQVPVVYRERIGVAKLHAVTDGARILLSILRFSRRTSGASADGRGEELPAPPLSGPSLRDLQSVLFALNSQRILVSTAPGGSRHLEPLVDELRRANPSIQIERPVSGPTGRVSSDPARRASSVAEETPLEARTPWSLVITLPKGALKRPGPTCTIRIPEGERRLYLDVADAPAASPAPSSPIEDLSRSQAYRLAQSSGRKFSSLRLLSSTLAQFAVQRDLALIAANAGQSPYAVYREKPEPPLRLRPREEQ